MIMKVYAAIVHIMKIQETGLVKAIATYNYLSCYEEIEVTGQMIRNYFN